MSGRETLIKVCKLIPLIALTFSFMSVMQEQDAHADILVGADLNGAFQLGEVSSDSLGLGANLRLGWQEDFIPVLRLAPELQVNYMGFAIESVGSGATDTAQNSRQRLLSARAGARVGFDFLVGGSLYSHIGYGFVDTQGTWAFKDNDGLSFDAGIAIDFTAIPFVNLGLHAGYNALFPGSNPDADPINWLDIGAHVELVF